MAISYTNAYSLLTDILNHCASALCINFITTTRESTVHDILQHSQAWSHHYVVYLISATWWI